MIKIDSRVGSAEIKPYLRGIPTELCRLEYGDFAFEGNGPDELPYLVGIERKAIGDLVQSMDSGRLSGHQLVGLTNSYNVIYLLVEGIWKPREDNTILVLKGKKWFPLEFGRRRYTYHEVTNFLNSLTCVCGLNVFLTPTLAVSGLWLKHIYAWWQKPWTDHKSHLQFNQSVEKQFAQLYEPPLMQRLVKELTGVGWKKSQAIAVKFPTMEKLLGADCKTLMEVEGIGKKLAKSIYEELRNG